jgi:hypothetical protein
MDHHPATALPAFAVVVFGDGRLPEVLLTCLQFHIVADQMVMGRAHPSHVLQLHGHVDRAGCRGCRDYLDGRGG